MFRPCVMKMYMAKLVQSKTWRFEWETIWMKMAIMDGKHDLKWQSYWPLSVTKTPNMTAIPHRPWDVRGNIRWPVIQRQEISRETLVKLGNHSHCDKQPASNKPFLPPQYASGGGHDNDDWWHQTDHPYQQCC